METYAEFSIFSQPAAPLPLPHLSLFTLWINGSVGEIDTQNHEPATEAPADQPSTEAHTETEAELLGFVEIPTPEQALVADIQEAENTEYQVPVQPLLAPELAESPAEHAMEERGTDDVFERFVQYPPPRRRVEPELQLDAAVERSIEEDEEIVTETMALISMRQGNRAEAVRIYSKLRLLFPEKAPYFDAQIEKIQAS